VEHNENIDAVKRATVRRTIGKGHDRMSPDQLKFRADEFLRLAQVFLSAYRALPEPWPPIPPCDWPRYFLLCHSMELALKAFLHIKGVSEQEMRKRYGHSLTKLLEAASVHGLLIGERGKRIPQYLNELHMDGWSRYPLPEDKKTAPIASVSYFVPEAERLLHEVMKHISGTDVAGTEFDHASHD
jgi:hypothetical protein